MGPTGLFEALPPTRCYVGSLNKKDVIFFKPSAYHALGFWVPC